MLVGVIVRAPLMHMLVLMQVIAAASEAASLPMPPDPAEEFAHLFPREKSVAAVILMDNKSGADVSPRAYTPGDSPSREPLKHTAAQQASPLTPQNGQPLVAAAKPNRSTSGSV